MTEENPPDSPPLPWWRRNWGQNLIVVLLGAAGVYGLIYWDVVSRAREAYRKAETYMAWHQDPEKKARHFERVFEERKARLDRRLHAGRISDDEHRRRLDALEFEKEFNLGESSLKYAYQWYKDTYELFSPPESRWVRKARERAPEALELWKQELREQNVPFEDYMFE